MSLRRQILILPIFVAPLACAILEIRIDWMGGQVNEMTRANLMNTASERLQTDLSLTEREALERAKRIAGLSQVQAAMAARDDDALKAVRASK